MKIAFVGAGGMGASIGCYAMEGGAELYFIDPFKAHIDALREKGLTVVDIGGAEPVTSTVRGMKCFYSPDEVGEVMDYIIYQVKAVFLDNALESARCITDEHTCHICLQNGLGNVEHLQAIYPNNRIIFGLISAGARMLEPGAIERNFKPDGKSFIKVGNPDKVITEEMKKLQTVFTNPSCPLILTEDVMQAIWTKMINNCTANAICAIARIPLGRLYNDEDGVKLAMLIEEELRAVAKAEGVTIPETPKLMGKFPPEFPHITSTAQDVFAKRKTEIDTINGSVSALGRKHGIPTPFNDAMIMVLRLIQNNYQYMLGVD